MSMDLFPNFKILVCFYQRILNTADYKLIAASFNISSNFNYINETSYNLESKIDGIKSSSNNEKNCLLCFKDKNNFLHCLKYQINENIFYIVNLPNKNCDMFETYFFNETNQYILIHKNESMNSFEIIKFNNNNENFEINSIQKIDLLECQKTVGFSLVYSKIILKYILITDCEKEDKWEIINKVPYFNSTYSNDDNPTNNNNNNLTPKSSLEESDLSTY